MRSLRGVNLVVERGPDVFTLPSDFWRRFEELLKASGVTKSERRQKERHEKDRLYREGWRQYWHQGEEFWVHDETGERATREAALSAVAGGEDS